MAQRSLSIEQENAVDLLIQGLSDKEVAEKVGVSRQTVNEWQNRNPLFIAELNRRRQEVWGSQVERLRKLVREAVDVLEEALKAKEMETRLKASVHVLRCVGIYGMDLTPRGETDPEEIIAKEAEKKAKKAHEEELNQLFYNVGRYKKELEKELQG